MKETEKEKKSEWGGNILRGLQETKSTIENFARGKIHTLELKRDIAHKKKEIETILNEMQHHPGKRGAHHGAIYRGDIEEITHHVAELKYQCKNLEDELTRLQGPR